MSLFETYMTDVTDKGTCHSYIENYYTKKFDSLKDKNITLLEIGIERGASIKLWKKWFTDIQIYAFDINKDAIGKLAGIKNVTGFCQDAFNEESLNFFNNDFFDIIIEDGPHTLESQIFAAKHWVKKLKVGGFMIIEDIQNPDGFVPQIIASIENKENYGVMYYDLRPFKSRYDDYILEITRIK